MTKRQGSTTERGYGYQHKKLRNQIKPMVDAGKCTCWRCGQTIQSGQVWDLGHDDNDRTKYRGPEHANAIDCPAGGNRATCGRSGVVMTGPLVDTSRDW